MSLSFTNPYFLLFLLILPVMGVLSFRSLAGLGGARRIAALALRAGILTLLIFSLAEAQIRKAGRDLSVFFLLDSSESIPRHLRGRALQFVNEAAEEMGAHDKSALIVFGREARFETPVERSLEVPRIESEISGAYTDIGAALRLARATFPEGDQKRIVLLSDGNENSGRATEEIQAAASLGIPIDIVPLRYEHQSEVLLEKVVVPEEVREGETFEVKIVVEAYQAGPAVVRLFEKENLVSSEQVDLKKGKNVFTVPRTITRKGFHAYEAVVESNQDSLYQNNRGYGYTIVAGEAMVLYLESRAGESPFLPQALASEKIKVDVRGIDQIPRGLAELQPYDLIIIDNVPASDLRERQMLTIESAVQDLGIGLIMVGGEDSFGAGGYRGSPIERALPVEMEIKQRKVMPNGALVLIMHTCEFANGNMWGKKISEKAVDTLSAHDQVGLLLYDYRLGGPAWLFRIQKVGNGKRMKSRIQSMAPGDMPDFDTTLKMAHTDLKATRAALKHIVIISDGDPSPPNRKQIIQMATKDKITISTVAIGLHTGGGWGAGAAGTMQQLAQLGNGRFYPVDDPASLPQIFVKEASVVRKSLIFEKPFTPRLVQSTEVVKGLATTRLPQLTGYVATTAKDLAEVPIIAEIDKTKDPILAHWRYGLGKSVAFTSDAKNRWAADWVGWGNYSKFWAQVVRWASRSGSRGEFQASSRVEGETATLSLDAVDYDGEFVNFLRFKGRYAAPSLEGADLAVEQTAPGRYETSFRTTDVGTYFVNLTFQDEDGNMGFYTTGIPVSYSPEYLKLRTNETFLHNARDLTGGRELSVQDPRGIFERGGLQVSRSHQDIWPGLVLAAALLFLGDIFIRRVWIPWEKIWAVILLVYGRLMRQRKRMEVISPVQRLLKAKPKLKGEGMPLKKMEMPSRLPSKDQIRAPTVGDVEKKKKPVTPPKGGGRKPAGKPEQTYTGRLLDAKKRAFKRRQE